MCASNEVSELGQVLLTLAMLQAEATQTTVPCCGLSLCPSGHRSQAGLAPSRPSLLFPLSSCTPPSFLVQNFVKEKRATDGKGECLIL